MGTGKGYSWLATESVTIRSACAYAETARPTEKSEGFMVGQRELRCALIEAVREPGSGLTGNMTSYVVGQGVYLALYAWSVIENEIKIRKALINQALAIWGQLVQALLFGFLS